MRGNRRTAETPDPSFVERFTRLSDRVARIRFQLEPGESYVVTGLAVRIATFPKAPGSLRLTNRRLIYIPPRGFGQFLRRPAPPATVVDLSQIETVSGGSRWRSLSSGLWAARELVVSLKDGQRLRLRAYGASQWRDLIVQAVNG
ncbi:MAG TPA: hypothetical protein VFY90_02240 [Tepidiformaceae bacterium]|nr:hypothetical protein [Tepidiformaceae bacterium]